jgi:hypothetical protein
LDRVAEQRRGHRAYIVPRCRRRVQDLLETADNFEIDRRHLAQSGQRGDADSVVRILEGRNQGDPGQRAPGTGQGGGRRAAHRGRAVAKETGHEPAHAFVVDLGKRAQDIFREGRVLLAARRAGDALDERHQGG